LAADGLGGLKVVTTSKGGYMSAFEEWLDDCIKMNKLEDDAALSPDDYFYNLEFVAEAFNAGRESLCSQRESYLRGHRAGRAYQREEDAKYVDTIRDYIYADGEIRELDLTTVAKAIREQKIDD